MMDGPRCIASLSFCVFLSSNKLVARFLLLLHNLCGLHQNVFLHGWFLQEANSTCLKWLGCVFFFFTQCLPHQAVTAQQTLEVLNCRKKKSPSPHIAWLLVSVCCFTLQQSLPLGASSYPPKSGFLIGNWWILWGHYTEDLSKLQHP